MTRATLKHVFVIPAGDDWQGDAINIGQVETAADAFLLVNSKGYTIRSPVEGGHYDEHDADDAPGIYGYERDGMGAFGITVEPNA
jgi:hypothetical protein